MAKASMGKRLHKTSPAPPVTIVDVARAARVSIATVSRTLNLPQKVSEEIRSRVLDAVADLRYLPHGAARALASRRSHTIGALVPTLDNAIFARGIVALQRRLNAAGYMLLLASTEYERGREVAEAQALLERGVDALMLVGAAHAPEVYRLLETKGLPFINTWSYLPAPGRPCVGFDNRTAAARLANYLVDLGHRRIAMIAGITQDNDRAAARVEGVTKTLARRGAPLQPSRLVERPYQVGDGRSAFRMLMALPEPPTAIICGNDVLAFGAVLEALASGVSVPGRVSITGFDDLDLASHIQPPLTTMRVPSTEMGTRAGDYLLARLNGISVPDFVELEAELIVRATTAPPGA
jgi:LacI family transcriptional regulator